jgi:hypothetical protein
MGIPNLDEAAKLVIIEQMTDEFSQEREYHAKHVI